MATHQTAVLSTPDSPSSPSDEVLLRRLIDGSQDAVATLYDRHIRAVYGAALRVTNDPGTASDVVQETFLALWNRAELFDPARGSLVAWLVTIARNRAIDRVRSANRHDRAMPFSSFANEKTAETDRPVADWLTAAGTLIAAADPERAPDIVVAERERRECLELGIGELPPLEREVIVLAYQGGLTQTEIAARLDWPLGTVKTRTRRALQILRERLGSPDSPCGVA